MALATTLLLESPRSAIIRKSLLGTVLLLVAGATCVGAGPLFSAPSLFDAGAYPYTVAIGDLDGDGRPDLVVANGATVSVLLGNGDGTFRARTDFGTVGAPLSAAIADFNADGRPDIVASAQIDNTNGVSMLLGNGDGTFGAPSHFETGRTPNSVAVADLDTDGRLDVATANIFQNTVSVLLGNGDGTFQPRLDEVVGPLYALAVGDLNGDGRPDLVTANDHAGKVSVHLGNGNGTFGAGADFGTGFTPAFVAIGDLNGDGLPDLAVANANSNSVSVLLGNGDGTFAARTDFGTSGTPYSNPFSVAIADLDRDGRPDLVTANTTSRTVSVLLGNGDGTFGVATVYATGELPDFVAVADLDGDGRPDLATANSLSSTVSVLLNVCPQRPMSFNFDPNTLNLHSMGHWVKATLEPEPPATPAEIDIASIRLNGSVPVDPSGPISIGDSDEDGRPDLSVRFSRAAMELVVAQGDSVPVTVSGKIGGGCFEATDVIRVIRSHVTAPTAGAVLQGGSTTEVRWDTPGGIQVHSVAMLWSSDDGANWTLVAQDLPNSGSYVWAIPGIGSEQARVAVVLVESADETGYEVSGVLGVSERFVIASPLGVGGTSVRLALQGSVPNPSTNPSVSFTLPDAEPATLAVYDVTGREMSRTSVGSLGPGRHVVTLAATGALAPGIYLVHLVRGERRLVTRTVVVR